MNLSFTVLGRPEPQGSTKAFMPKGWTRPVLTSDNKKLKPWRQDVSGKALEAMHGKLTTEEAVEVRVRFYFAKPKSTPKRVVEKITKPDVDKLLRGILDSLTGIVFADDAQVTGVACEKLFGLPERAEIEVRAKVREVAA